MDDRRRQALALAAMLIDLLLRPADRDDDGSLHWSTEIGCWPPRCRSRRQARDRIKKVPEHVREGRGKDTVWSVAKDAYRAHYGTRKPPAKVKVEPISAEDAAAVDRILAIGGVRATRRSA